MRNLIRRVEDLVLIKRPQHRGAKFAQLEAGLARHAKFVICDHTIDITYIRLIGGFVYLVAISDWYSRFVLSSEISVTLDSDFCVSALERALRAGQPEVFNTDQGAQFTSVAFTERLLEREIRISMDGRGRALDNIFVERLWRRVKYEGIYLNDYASVPEVKGGLKKYFDFYNAERLHQSLNYRTPAVVHGLLA